MSIEHLHVSENPHSGGGQEVESSKNEARQDMVGKKVKFTETDRNKRHSVNSYPGRIERVAGEKLYVIMTDKLFGPSGPYEVDLEDVEFIE